MHKPAALHPKPGHGLRLKRDTGCAPEMLFAKQIVDFGSKEDIMQGNAYVINQYTFSLRCSAGVSCGNNFGHFMAVFIPVKIFKISYVIYIITVYFIKKQIAVLKAPGMDGHNQNARRKIIVSREIFSRKGNARNDYPGIPYEFRGVLIYGKRKIFVL
jgi:hypothetical protein